MALRIEYIPVAELIQKMHPANPKQHDLGAIIQSYKTHGFVSPGTLDARTDYFLCGHGRTEALAMMIKQRMDAPDGIVDNGNGWECPVVCGYESKNDTQALAYLAADNKLTIMGGWNEPALAALLQEVANSTDVALEATGFDSEELDNLLRDLGRVEEDDNYSRKIEAPTYEPTGEKPPIADLFDNSKTKKLIADIEQYESLADDEKEFLIIAAQRHTVLDFGKIAEYYSHADEGLQAIMEDSALVIIDFNKAIELGFVQLTERIAELAGQEYGE